MNIERLKSVRVEATRTKPVWSGPEGTDSQGGITQSMISRFLSCRERARVLFVEGLRPKEKFNHKTFFGECFHLSDEWWSRSGNATTGNTRGQPDWLVKLGEFAQKTAEKYPFDLDQIDKWYNVCKVTFPQYIEYWKAHPDHAPRTSLLQEQVFDVPYKLPSGRTVRLRGKWDGVSLVGRGKDAGIWLDESKTKGEVDEGRITRQLTFDLQTMMYLVALTESAKYHPHVNALSKHPITGIRYNVVRRPLSGGKGTIVQHKPTKSNPSGESKEDYYKRLEQYIKDEPHTYFFRWDVAVTPADIEKFKAEFLNPCLENVCDWWCRLTDQGIPIRDDKGGLYQTPLHWRHPFGVTNVLDDGGSSDLDSYLESGTTVGLERVSTLFRELE